MSARLVLLLSWVGCLIGLSAGEVLATPIDDADFQQVYLTKDEALRYVFPDALRVVELRHLLTRDETREIEVLVGRRLEEGGFFLYAAWDGDGERSRGDASATDDADPSSYAAIVMEVGKVRPITHVVEVRPGGRDGRTATVGRVAVMIYRETHGAEVAGERFMAQYAGKTLDDPIRVDRDVIHIAGSTLSAHAICRGVRKALAAIDVVFLRREPSERTALLARADDVTPTHAPTPAPGAETLALPGDSPEDVVRERRVMGTLARVTLCAAPDGPTRDALDRAAEAALDEIARWDGVLSDWRTDSELSSLNAAPRDASVALSPDLRAYLAHADALVRATDGAFDPAVGALVDAWGLRTPTPVRPDAARLAAARAASGWSHLRLDLADPHAARTVDGLRLDPGASGKGFALDRAADVLRGRGVSRALLSFRSTFLALGAPPGEPGFELSVQHDGTGRVLARVTLVDAALSVSGGLPDGFDDGAVTRGHVLDPRSGVPLPAARLAWVTASSAADADALSTALLVAGPMLPAFVDAAGRVASGGFVADADARPAAWPDRDAPATTARPAFPSASPAPDRVAPVPATGSDG
ncbi:MAG: FAD:protein FMN transferase [Planctomycetes bacterium]|nr:FAD:protein FMN transferase [Planctomycetota bacterium]